MTLARSLPACLLPLVLGGLTSCVYPKLDGAATPSFAFDGAVRSGIGGEIQEVLSRHGEDTGLYLLGDGPMPSPRARR